MIDIDKYKQLLEEEQIQLESELNTVGEKTTSDGDNWVPTMGENAPEESADPIDVADRVEEYAERVGIEGPLEERLDNVKMALAAIAAGTYGICMEGGEAHPIEIGRLEANPAALTCTKHMR